MTPAVLAISIGTSMALLLFALRSRLMDRWSADLAWAEHAVWCFTPRTIDCRPFVVGYYGLLVTVALAALISSWNVSMTVTFLVLLVAHRVVFAIAWRRRRLAIEGQLPDAVRQISSSVASGMTLVQAIERAAERAPTPIRSEFRIMANLWKLGSDLTAIIEEARRRLNLASFNLFASAVIVNQRMGGNVTETLDQLADSLDEIDRMKKRIKAETAEGRTNVKVLILTPLVMLGFVALADRPAFVLLFTTAMGQALLGTATVLTLAGFLWAWRIVHADV